MRMMIPFLRIRASRTTFPSSRTPIRRRKVITDRVSHLRKESSPLSKSAGMIGI